MDRNFQRATFVDQLCALGGDFPAAYASLQEQARDAVVSEDHARQWAREISSEALDAGARETLRRFLAGEPPASAALVLPENTTGKEMMARLEIGAMRVVEDVFLDLTRGKEEKKYSDKVVAGTAMKFMELMGTPGRHASGGSGGQRAHQQVTPEAGVFGRVPDREALLTYVEQALSIPRLTARLRAKGDMLAGLEEAHVARVLRDWQRAGVVLDPASGEVTPWEEALAWARETLGLYDAPPLPPG